jgi:type IV secretory pathway protease TraF
VKAPGKKRVPRMQSAKREEDLAKRINRRNTQKKTFVSKTIALEQDKLAMALVPVQLDNEGTAMQSMMLRRRKATQDMAKMMDKKRKAVLSNDLIKLN